MTHRNFTLSKILVADGATCALMGILLVSAAGPLGKFSAIPAPLLFWAGVSLLPIAIFMFVVARTNPLSSAGAKAVIVGNALWISASIALPLSGVISPNSFGWTFLIGQAAFVMLLTILEFRSLPARSNAVA